MYKNITIGVLGLLVFLGGYLKVSERSKQEIDLTPYESKIKSLELKLDSLNGVLEVNDSLLTISKEKYDSLKQHENKVYKYYDKKIDDLRTLSDSSHLLLFNKLTR